MHQALHPLRPGQVSSERHSEGFGGRMPRHLQLLRRGLALRLERGSRAGSPGFTELQRCRQEGRRRLREGVKRRKEGGGAQEPPPIPHKVPPGLGRMLETDPDRKGTEKMGGGEHPWERSPATSHRCGRRKDSGHVQATFHNLPISSAPIYHKKCILTPKTQMKSEALRVEQASPWNG